jgi:hypothetical protein
MRMEGDPHINAPQNAYRLAEGRDIWFTHILILCTESRDIGKLTKRFGLPERLDPPCEVCGCDDTDLQNQCALPNEERGGSVGGGQEVRPQEDGTTDG